MDYPIIACINQRRVRSTLLYAIFHSSGAFPKNARCATKEAICFIARHVPWKNFAFCWARAAETHFVTQANDSWPPSFAANDSERQPTSELAAITGRKRQETRGWSR